MIYYRSILRLSLAALLACVLSGLLVTLFGQTPTPTPKPLPTPKRGKPISPDPVPKRGRPVIEKEDGPAPEIVTVIKEVKPNEGALVLFAVPGAKVTLIQIRSNGKDGAARDYNLAQDNNTLNLYPLAPGKYKITIEHPDYNPYTETKTISIGKPTSITSALVSKFGSINIVGAPAGAKILLDGKEPDSAYTRATGEAITLDRVPVGAHRLKISKEGYADREDQPEVLPGRSTPVSANLERATITVIFESVPGAEVYIDNQKRGTILPEGQVTISLLPGSHTARVTKDGYDDWKEGMTLSLENRSVKKKVTLIPIPESKEGDWLPDYGNKRWTQKSTKWDFDKETALIKGDAIELYATDQNRDYNFYQSFNLVFRLKFDKGAAWVVRAKDRSNYYLFELNGPQRPNPNTLIFYIYRDGVPKELDRKIIPGNLVKDDQFRITVEARGDKFTVWLHTNRNPTSDSRGNPIGNFQDKTFSTGGVGFCGKDGIEISLKSFIINPDK